MLQEEGFHKSKKPCPVFIQAGLLINHEKEEETQT